MNTVLKLCERYFGSNRCITADNFFTSISLAANLKTHNLELIGTINKNKLEIPPEFKAEKSRKIDSSLFAFKNYMTLVSYVPKINKAVLLLSTKSNRTHHK